MTDRRLITQLLADLVAIDSVNPDLVTGGAGEEAIAGFVAGWLERAGLDVAVATVQPGRPNVVAVAGGRGGGKTLLLNGHMDTVGYAGMEAPLSPRVEGHRLYGRGAYDMKSGLASIMLAGAHAARSSLAGDVVVAAVIDEEMASLGSEAVAASVDADAAIVAEPTELDVCIAHKGFVWLEVETRGRAAHGSLPDLGEDAIVAMGPVLTGLGELDVSLRRDRQPHRLLGGGSLHASLIEGGQELSSYPERCLVAVERRTVPGESAETVRAEIAALGDEAEVRTTFVRGPLETDAGEAIVQAVVARARASGLEPKLVGAPFWTDAAIFAAKGIPSVLFGPGGEGAHAVVEWADLEQLERCVAVLEAVIDDFCG